MPKRKKSDQPRKMSDIMKVMSDRLFRAPAAAHSSEAAHVALFFATLAWNDCVGLGAEREPANKVWQAIEANNPAPWPMIRSGTALWRRSTRPAKVSDVKFPIWGNHELPSRHRHLLGPYAASGKAGSPFHSIHGPACYLQRDPGGAVYRSV